MKLILFLEHRFFALPDGKTVYCERNVDYSFLCRYLNVFEEVCVCARVKEVDSGYVGNLKANGKGVSFLKLPDFRGSKGILQKYHRCKKIIADNIMKYDAIMLRAPSPISIIALDEVIKSGKPFASEFVINPRTMFNKESNPTKKFIIGGMQRVFISHAKRLCKYANGVSYVTEHVLQEEYPCRAIKNGESTDYFTGSYSTINLYEKDYYGLHPLKDEKEPVVICHTGYMDGYSKGHITVMQVAKRCIEDGLNIYLKFIGSGSIEDEFKLYADKIGISDKVEFTGQLFGYKAVQQALITSDIFLFPTRSEGLPRSLIEAMANGLACISSPVDGIKELLPSRYLVDYNDVNKLVKVTEELVRDIDKRHSVAKINYETSKKYEASILNKCRDEFYKKLYKLAERNNE